MIEESPLTKMKAVSKGSLEIEEGGPTDQVLGTRATKEPIEDHNDDLHAGSQRPRGAIEQVQALEGSSQGGRPCHQTDGSTIKEDAFEDVCHCNVDHEVVRYQDFVNLFLEKSAETYSGFEVGHVMVSVPAFFDHSQRQAIRDAGAISGL